jgi:hypothetical protein
VRPKKAGYESVLLDLVTLIDAGRKAALRSVNAIMTAVAQRFPLPWSHYVRLLSVRNPMAQEFYETEALRGGWTLRQLERQIDSQFYERTALSRNKVAMLRSGAKRRPEDESRHEEHLKEPYFLEFLNLKDECPENDTAVATYALEGLSSKVLAAEYKTALPKERTLVAEIQKTRRQLERRRS